MRKISKKERAALTIAGAQRLAGAGRTPSARQVRKAHDEAGCAVAKHGVVVHGGADTTDGLVNKICGKLSGIGGETDAECGSFWGKIKDTVSAMLPFAGLASSGITAALAIKQLRAPAQGQGRVMVSPPQAAPAPAPAPDAASDTDASSAQAVAAGGWGRRRTRLGTEISRPEKGYVYLFGDDELGAYATIEGDDLFGDDGLLGTEDAMYASAAGGAEAEAIDRIRGFRSQGTVPAVPGYNPRRAPPTSTAGSIPHDAYRALIFQQAQRLGGPSPTAKQMAAAQATVDKAMAARKISVAIPGARPGRVTR